MVAGLTKTMIKDYITGEKFFEIILLHLSNEILNNTKYRLEIGKVLYGNGIERQGYIITPYNIEISKNMEFICEVSICYGKEQKNSVPIMNGLIIFFSGRYSKTDRIMESGEFINFDGGAFVLNKIEFLEWPTDIPLTELKKMVGSVSYPVTFKKEDVENEKFVKYMGDEYKNNENFKTHEIKISNLGRVMVDNNIVEMKKIKEKKVFYIFLKILLYIN